MKKSDRFEARIQRLRANNTSYKALKNKKAAWSLVSYLVLCIFSFYAFTNFYNGDENTISVAAEHMNIIYMDVPNPITVAVAGVPVSKVTLRSSELKLENRGNGHYIATVLNPGKAFIEVSGEDFETCTFEFKVDGFPDVIAVLDHPSIKNLAFGDVPSFMFWETKGLTINSRELDYQLDFEIKNYKLSKVPRKGDPVEINNKGAALNENAIKIIRSAEAGDVFYFENIVVGAKLLENEYVSWTLNKPKSVVYKMIK